MKALRQKVQTPTHENDCLCSEELARIARRGRIKGRRGRPAARIRTRRRQIARDRGPIEEPELDAGVVPERRVGAPAAGCEPRAVRARRRVLHDAALVPVCRVEAVGGDNRAGLERGRVGGGRVRAAVGGVQGVAVVRCGVDVLNYVDLAVAGPVGALHPERGPHRALSAGM